MYGIRFDTSHLERTIIRLIEAARNDSIKQVSTTYIRELPKLYAQGLGGDGLPMPGYNEAYAKRLDIPLTPKTLKRSEGRLYDLVLDGDTVTVRDSREISLGQQTGHSGDWAYSNVMFAPNETLQSQAAEELAHYLSERIRF
ncbi:hypothetical protein KGP36_07730 [Patescibacteria group bacterium]|nr:hypothetical protein [Patescibacteria group bacterium]